MPDGRHFVMLKPEESDGQPQFNVVLVQHCFEELKRRAPTN